VSLSRKDFVSSFDDVKPVRDVPMRARLISKRGEIVLEFWGESISKIIAKDVAALGEGYQVFVNGKLASIGGTSASTPAFAGLISLLNDARIKAGKPPMGYLNPWLYQNAGMFTDVTLGDNAYGRGPFRTPYGFNATKGWDPVTGLGTPVADKMLAYLQKLQRSRAASALVV